MRFIDFVMSSRDSFMDTIISIHHTERDTVNPPAFVFNKSATISPYNPNTSAKINIRIIPTNNFGCCAVPRTPASPTIPIAKPAARPAKPTLNPAPSWMNPVYNGWTGATTINTIPRKRGRWGSYVRQKQGLRLRGHRYRWYPPWWPERRFWWLGRVVAHPLRRYRRRILRCHRLPRNLISLGKMITDIQVKTIADVHPIAPWRLASRYKRWMIRRKEHRRDTSLMEWPWLMRLLIDRQRSAWCLDLGVRWDRNVNSSDKSATTTEMLYVDALVHLTMQMPRLISYITNYSTLPKTELARIWTSAIVEWEKLTSTQFRR